MDRKTSRDLDAAFSLLPANKARKAKQNLLEVVAGGGFIRRLLLKWSEHDAQGNFRRGGITDMIDRSTRLVANSQEDGDVQLLAAGARVDELRAGALRLLPSNDRFAWYLPFSPTTHDDEPSLRLRGLMVTEPVFWEALEQMNPGLDLTPAERRVLFQITAGLTPRVAAKQDAVSFETKRAHIKTASAKMHFAGQTDLVRKVLGQLVHLLWVSEGEVAHSEPVERFVERYLADDVRLVLRRLPGGRLLRLLECGPQDGRTVVMIHGMMFPISLVGLSRHLEATRIRLVVPIRPGFLESRPAAELAGRTDLVAAAIADLAALLNHEGGKPVVILGQSLGAMLAIRFANRHPELVSQLILQSINLTGGDRSGGGASGHFYGGLKSLSQQPDLFKLVNWQFKKYYADRRTGRQILSRLFANSVVDMAALDGETTGTEAYAMFAELYASSVFGMSADFDFVMNAWQREARAIGKPITFVHGDCDPLTGTEEIRPFVDHGPSNRLVTVRGGGHFIAVSHARETWRTVGECLEINGA